MWQERGATWRIRLCLLSTLGTPQSAGAARLAVAPFASRRCEIVSMSDATSAFSVAARILGDVTLSPWQLTQLRAIDRRYQQALFGLLDGARRRPTTAEVAPLDESAAQSIFEILTPEQLAALPPRR